jgi:hypothetical protein
MDFTLKREIIDRISIENNRVALSFKNTEGYMLRLPSWDIHVFMEKFCERSIFNLA